MRRTVVWSEEKRKIKSPFVLAQRQMLPQCKISGLAMKPTEAETQTLTVK